MCQNATQTAASLMAAIEPTLKGLLQFAGIAFTPEAQAAITAFEAATLAVKNWKSGTTAQNALTLIGDFQTVFNTLPLPSNVSMLVNIILAGVETVIGVLTANSPAPAAPAGATATAQETQEMFQAHVAIETEKKVTALVPTFKRSFFHTVPGQYKKTWNDEIQKENLPTALKV